MVFPWIVDLVVLEAMACQEALSLASNLSLDQVQIAFDCKEVVNDISSSNGGLHGDIVREIIRALASFHKCSIIFDGRASNLEHMASLNMLLVLLLEAIFGSNNPQFQFYPNEYY